jgi:hypothetical protein
MSPQAGPTGGWCGVRVRYRDLIRVGKFRVDLKALLAPTPPPNPGGKSEWSDRDIGA